MEQKLGSEKEHTFYDIVLFRECLCVPIYMTNASSQTFGGIKGR